MELKQIPPRTEARLSLFLAIGSPTHSSSLDPLQSPTNPSHLPPSPGKRGILHEALGCSCSAQSLRTEDGAALEVPSIPAARNQPEFQVRHPTGCGSSLLVWHSLLSPGAGGTGTYPPYPSPGAPQGDLGLGKDLFIKPQQQESNPCPGGPATCR